jgi:tetratricopeptide (TPR) repeat protein
VRGAGALSLVLAAWPAVQLIAELPRQFAHLSYWIELGLTLPVGLLCGAGGLALIRGRRTGYPLVYAGVFLLVIGWYVPRLPGLRQVLVPHLGLPVVARWPVNVALLAVIIATHLLSRRVPGGAPPGSPKGSWLRVSLVGMAGICYLSCLYCWARVEQEAGAVVTQAYSDYAADRDGEAMEAWDRVIATYPHTSAWGVAVFNSGLCERRRGHYREAIGRFELILPAPLDDRLPSGNLMEAYLNFHHNACVQLSGCYEELRDYGAALHYALLARDTYPYESWCGTCLIQEGAALSERIDRLEQKVRNGG